MESGSATILIVGEVQKVVPKETRLVLEDESDHLHVASTELRNVVGQVVQHKRNEMDKIFTKQ